MQAGRGSLERLTIHRLAQDDERRYIDLALEFREVPKRKGARGKLVGSVGGRWDRELGVWSDDPPDEVVVWELQPAQYDAARWFMRWLVAHAQGKRLPGAEELICALMFAGGRRGGKSDAATRFACAYAVAKPGAIVWLISPTQDETDELRDVLDRIMPDGWFHYEETKQIYHFWNGARIELKSGFKPSSLKRGRVDFWVLNEAQNATRRAYTILRAPIADRGGLGICTCNPPDTASGQWVLDMYEGVKAGSKTIRLFEFDAKKNPHVDWRLLEAMKDEPNVTEEDYRREVLGEFIPIGDLVFYAFSLKFNVSPDVPHTDDLHTGTMDFTSHHLGRAYPWIVVADFQKFPHMAATVWRQTWEDDLDDWRSWIVAEAVVPQATEHDLIDALERMGLTGDACAVVADASGEWQDAERTKGRGSFDVFRERGWRGLYMPDSESTKNPDIIASARVANGLFKNVKDERRIIVSSNCPHTIRSVSRWENRNGAPHKRSDFAHIGDTVRYFAWRFYPPRLTVRGFDFENVPLDAGERERELDGL